MSNIKTFSYQGNPINFSQGKNLMVNATEMAKPFGKRPVDWLRFGPSSEFINAFSKVSRLTLADLLKVINGGNNPGTWMHEDVALEFARWLSPEFAIWCNNRIKELLRHGATAINPDNLLDPDFIIKLATQLKQERAARAQLEAQNNELKPKAELMDDALNTDKLIDMGQTNQIKEVV